MDVPLFSCELMGPVISADLIPVPGANILTQLPQLEKPDLLSLRSVEPTAMAPWAPAGVVLQAFVLLLPAETATKIPALVAAVIALSTACVLPPLMLTFATIGLLRNLLSRLCLTT